MDERPIFCSGNDECILSYNPMKKIYICIYDCKFIKCTNYELCHTDFTKNNKKEICINCDITFGMWVGCSGVLEFKDNESCCICLEDNKRSIKLLKCNHYLCIECFKTNYYGLKPKEFDVPFPLDDEDYVKFMFDPCEYQNNRLIQEWLNQYEDWNNEQFDRQEKSIQGVCPLCRI